MRSRRCKEERPSGCHWASAWEDEGSNESEPEELPERYLP